MAMNDEGWTQQVAQYMAVGNLMFQCDQLGIDKAKVRQAWRQGSLWDAYEMAGYLAAEKAHHDAAQALRDQEGL